MLYSIVIVLGWWGASDVGDNCVSVGYIGMIGGEAGVRICECQSYVYVIKLSDGFGCIYWFFSWYWEVCATGSVARWRGYIG